MHFSSPKCRLHLISWACSISNTVCSVCRLPSAPASLRAGIFFVPTTSRYSTHGIGLFLAAASKHPLRDQNMSHWQIMVRPYLPEEFYSLPLSRHAEPPTYVVYILEVRAIQGCVPEWAIIISVGACQDQAPFWIWFFQWDRIIKIIRVVFPGQLEWLWDWRSLMKKAARIKSLLK